MLTGWHAREQAIIDIFERTAPAVVNVFDLSLQSGGGRQLSTDSPEGNGTGVVWDSTLLAQDPAMLAIALQLQRISASTSARTAHSADIIFLPSPWLPVPDHVPRSALFPADWTLHEPCSSTCSSHCVSLQIISM